ncbi:discoidin domain-containing protein [Myxococcus stipitatus]|uniref:carboxylesterase family protein n=1 Tax=Myxococcus stipitatus TaxID=83455 RepID=UPI001F18219D|nr:discoidin domain-containing protein [Myxococcus stipitatus]MCE9670904.1 discoidin domain-containing protein [Myxococcus stipitatus]
MKKHIVMGSWALALLLVGCDGATEAPAGEPATRASALDGGLVNVTLSKPATASHVQTDPYFPPEKAVDGNITSDDSRWCPGPYRLAQRYLDIDLQGTFDLHRVELYTGYRDIRPVANYDLHYYDGTSWLPIPGAAKTGNTSIAVSTTFTQVVRGQRVRFLCNEPNEENCRVKELWVFGLPVTPGANQPPVANAGADQSITLPTSSLTLAGSATDADGTITSYAWTQVSGPTATLSNASTATLSVSGLVAGTFVFRLTVTDDDGATHSDDVTVTATSADTLTNVAQGKPTTAMHSGFPAANATDDNLTTRWVTSYNPDRPGTYLDVDLQGAYELHTAEVHLGTSATASDAMQNFILQSWDGGCWKDIPGSAVTANPVTTTVKSLAFTAPVVATKVRLLCLDSVNVTADDQKKPCVVRELKVQGKAAPAPTGAMSCRAGEQYAVRNSRYAYAAFLPAGYNADRAARWPLVISLHGTGGVTLNADLQSVATTPEGLAWNLQDATFRSTFGAIAVSPHYYRAAKSGSAWFSPNTVLALLEDLKKDFLVDTDRVYVTGFSGGANTLYEEILLPNLTKFAAFVPIAVTTTPTNIPGYCGFRTLPIWPFHGALDGQSDPGKSTYLKTLLETQCGATTSAMKLPTVYANLGHDPALCRNAYATQALWDWLFQQRVSTRGN